MLMVEFERMSTPRFPITEARDAVNAVPEMSCTESVLVKPAGAATWKPRTERLPAAVSASIVTDLDPALVIRIRSKLVLGSVAADQFVVLRQNPLKELVQRLVVIAPTGCGTNSVRSIKQSAVRRLSTENLLRSIVISFIRLAQCF